MASAISLVPLAAQGQTWISAVDGSWSDVSRWTTAPVSSATTALVFAPTGSQTYTATDDLAGPFLLNALNLGGNSSGSITLGAGSLSSMQLIGVNPVITNSGLSPVTLLGRITIPASGLTLNLNAPNNNFTSLGAVMGGTGGLVINSTGTGSVQLAARNTFTGNVTLSNALIDLPTQTSLGSGSLTVNNATLSTSNFVAPFGYGPVLPNFANNVTINAGGLKLGGNFGFTLAGNISGAGGVSLSPTNLQSGTWTLAGSNTFTGSLTVNGPGTLATNMLVINSPASLGNTPTINLSGPNARIGFVGGISTFTVNAPMSLTNGGAIQAINSTANAKIVYAGKISGTGGLSILPGGSVTLTGANDFTGGLNLLGGTTAVNSFQNFGAASGTVTFSGGSLVLNPGFGVTSRKFNVAVSGSTLYNFDDVTFDGTFSNASSQGFTKAGAGNLLMTASSSFSGPLLIAGGTITAGGNLGIVTAGLGSITIDAGAGLVLDNTAAAIQRVSSTGSIILSGGNLTVIGNGTQTSSTTVNTQFTVGSSVNESGSGFSVIDLQTTEDTATQVKFSTLSRGGNGGTQVLFTGARLGQVAVSTPTAGATNFSFTTSPASQLINGIFPWAIADSNAGIGTDFATYSATNGIQPLASYSSDFTGGLTANVAVTSTTLSTGVASLASNSIKLSGGTVNVAGGTLTIGSGAILAVNAPSAFSGGTLIIGTGTTNTTTAPTANFFCNADLTVSSNLTNFDPSSGLPSGIAKSGPGVLLLSGANSYSGPTFVLNGTLRVGSASAIPSTSEIFVNPGATFDVNGFAITTGAINQTVGSFTVGNNNFGTISIGANTLTAGNDDNSSVFQGNITGSGTFNKQGLGTFTVMGSQAFTGTVTLAKGAMILGTHATRGTGFAQAARINIGTTATSADVVLAFDFGVENFSVPMSVQTNSSGRTAMLKFLQSPNGTAGTNIASSIILNGATCGLIVDSSGGATLSGLISGAGSLMTQSTATSAAAGPLGFSLNITGANSYTGTTTLDAPVTLWGNVSAFGAATSAIGLGSTTSLNNPELSSSVGGLTLTRSITLNDSTNAAAAFGTIGSRAAAGSASTTYSGNISIAGQRSRLVIYSLAAPVSVTGVISGAQPTANVQIGATLGTGLEFTNSNVTLSGSSTFAGGTRLYCGTLNIGNSTTLNGQTITSGPLGTGTFFIGTAAAPGATEPTINAVGATRTIANPIVLSNNFTIGAQSPLILSGTVDLNAAARFVSVNSVATFSGAIIGASGSALIKDGAGTMQLSGSATHSGPTVVNAGTLAMLATQRLQGNLAIGPSSSVTMKPGGATFLTVPALTIDAANSGSLDLADDDAVIDYAPASPSPINSIAALIKTGYASAAWTGPGITSSSAASVAANIANTHKTAIGFAEASTFGIGTFAGQAVDTSAVLLRYTVVGDANIDGTVDTSDFNVLAANFNMTNALWQQGDFNFDGVVNALDFNNLSNNFGQILPSPALGSVVPEPAVLAPLVLISLLRRRRK